MTTNTLPTVPQATQFQGLFDHLNKHIFENKLHSCMLVFSRNANVIGGYFSPEKWVNEDTETTVHEIGLNANVIKQQSFLEVIDTIIHEMIHLEQHLEGTASRAGYHNRKFTDRCEALGIEVIGKGQDVSTKIKPGGLAEKVALEMPENLLFDWTSNELHIPDPNEEQNSQAPQDSGASSKPKSGKRSTYQCPICGCKVWGKGGMVILCGTCDERRMVESN